MAEERTNPAQTGPAQQVATPPVAEPQTAQGVATEAQAESFWKGDPTKLPPELQQIYKSMQADYTRKMQQLSEERKKWESQLREASETLRYYQQLLPYFTQGQAATTQAAQGEAAPQVTWDPLDENSVRAYLQHHFNEYAKQYAQYLNNALQWQWYILVESNRLSRMYPEFNIQEVLQYAPQYNWNLEATARALYETRKKYEEAARASELAKKVQELESQLAQLRKQAATSFVANGPSRPYRFQTNPKEVRTLQDIAAEIPPEMVLER